MSMSELGRLPAVDGEKARLVISPGMETLIFGNALSAVIYGRWGGLPSATEWDFFVSGSALVALPIIGGVGMVNLIVVYPGAVPATDVQAIVWASECCWPPFVGAI